LVNIFKIRELSRQTISNSAVSIRETFWSVWVIVGSDVSDLLNPRLFDNSFHERVCNWTIRFGNPLRMRQTADLPDYDSENMILPGKISVLL